MSSTIREMGVKKFREQLPILIVSSRNKWVAYHGAIMLGIDRSEEKLRDSIDTTKHPLADVAICHIVEESE